MIKNLLLLSLFFSYESPKTISLPQSYQDEINLTEKIAEPEIQKKIDAIRELRQSARARSKKGMKNAAKGLLSDAGAILQELKKTSVYTLIKKAHSKLKKDLAAYPTEEVTYQRATKRRQNTLNRVAEEKNNLTNRLTELDNTQKKQEDTQKQADTRRGELQQILGIKWYDTELEAKLQSIKYSCFLYGEKAATLFRAAIDVAEKDMNNENMKKHMIEKLLKDVVYTDGKHGPAITIRGVWEKPLSCEDARPEDFTEKFGIHVAQKENHINSRRLRNTLRDIPKSYIYNYKQSGLAGLEPAIREKYMPTPEQLEKLIEW